MEQKQKWTQGRMQNPWYKIIEEAEWRAEHNYPYPLKVRYMAALYEPEMRHLHPVWYALHIRVPAGLGGTAFNALTEGIGLLVPRNARKGDIEYRRLYNACLNFGTHAYRQNTGLLKRYLDEMCSAAADPKVRDAAVRIVRAALTHPRLP